MKARKLSKHRSAIRDTLVRALITGDLSDEACALYARERRAWNRRQARRHRNHA